MSGWEWLLERDGFLGCVVCNAAGASGAFFANFRVCRYTARKGNIERHAELVYHKNVERRWGSKHDDPGLPFSRVPSDVEFGDVWLPTKGGASARIKRLSRALTLTENACLVVVLGRSHPPPVSRGAAHSCRCYVDTGRAEGLRAHAFQSV